MVKSKAGIDKRIRAAVLMLSKLFSIEKVVLFGSQANGSTDQDSDIDLAVISPDFEGNKLIEFIDIFADISLKLNSGVEIHPFTTRELADAKSTGFLGHILDKGKIVFDNGSFLI